MPNTTYGTPYAQSSDLVSNWPGVSSNVADRIDDVSFKGNGLNDQTGTSYTLVLTDAGKTVTLNNASAVTVTIPTNASVAYETGTVIELTNKGAGVVTVSPAGGVTLNNSVTLAQNASASIKKLDTNTWVMIGAQASGLTLITSSTFSAVSSVSVNNCFTSTFENYRIIMFCTFATASSHGLRLRASGSDDTGTNYRINGHQSQASAFNLNEQSLTSFYFSSVSNNLNQHVVVDITRPALAAPTGYSGIGASWDATSGNRAAYFGGLHISSTAYDGFTFTASQNATGTLRVYGYRNS